MVWQFDGSMAINADSMLYTLLRYVARKGLARTGWVSIVHPDPAPALPDSI